MLRAGQRLLRKYDEQREGRVTILMKRFAMDRTLTLSPRTGRATPASSFPRVDLFEFRGRFAILLRQICAVIRYPAAHTEEFRRKMRGVVESSPFCLDKDVSASRSV